MEHDPGEQQVQRQHRQGHRADDREVAGEREEDPDRRRRSSRRDRCRGRQEVDGTAWMFERPPASRAPPCSRRPSIIPRAQRRRWRAKRPEVVGRSGEGDRGALVANPAALRIIAQVRTMSSPIRSASRRPLQRRRAIDAEGALGDHRPLEEALLALHRGDPEEVVPLLRAGDEVAAGIADEAPRRRQPRCPAGRSAGARRCAAAPTPSRECPRRRLPPGASAACASAPVRVWALPP